MYLFDVRNIKRRFNINLNLFFQLLDTWLLPVLDTLLQFSKATSKFRPASSSGWVYYLKIINEKNSVRRYTTDSVCRFIIFIQLLKARFQISYANKSCFVFTYISTYVNRHFIHTVFMNGVTHTVAVVFQFENEYLY